MTISMVELLNEGKVGRPEVCEDLYVITPDFVAVIDGATNISDRLIEGKAPGRFAAEVIQETLLGVQKDVTLVDLIAQINGNLQRRYQIFGMAEEIEKNAWMAPTACLICYSRYYHEVWQIGDSQCMIDGRLYTNDKPIDAITANARAMYLETELKKGKTLEDLMEHDTGWDYIKPLIKQQYYLQNDKDNQFGFEVINGFDVDFSRVKIIEVPVNAETMILASDGYPIIKETLAETEVALSQLLATDPLCFRQFKTSKGLQKGNRSFDDRTYIRFEVNR
ncbi:hypothetical protein [Sporosarcina sp. FSL K6-2383]|uniref:hypothetical protein n=1 Tax=Sporosarcina sp. FSL K6-2383 TaxID=2921556 RepID=UPI00315AB5F6